MGVRWTRLPANDTRPARSLSKLGKCGFEIHGGSVVMCSRSGITMPGAPGSMRE